MTFTGRTIKIADEVISYGHHVLVAGMTGAGKSTFIEGLINTILYSDPAMNKMILIDPKRVELGRFKRTSHCIAFAKSVNEAEKALESVLKLIYKRLEIMEAQEVTFFNGCKVYVIIDELAVLMHNSKKAQALLQEILEIGRAANIKVIGATQNPNAEVIPSRIRVNFGTIVGLHTATKQQSRNILDIAGCEELPIGYAIIRTPRCEVKKVSFPKIQEEYLKAIIDYRRI